MVRAIGKARASLIELRVNQEMENLPKVLRDHRGSRDLSSDASDGDDVYQKPLDATDDARQSYLVGYGNTPQSTSANVFLSGAMETATARDQLSGKIGY